MPQGSWLGPISFLVLIDDLHVDCLLHKYVDDTTLTELLHYNGNQSDMQSFFQQLLSWAANNDMIVNFTKTKEMILRPPSKTVHLTPLSTDNGYIEQVNSFKLLGLYVDNNFSWTSHIDAILSKATTRLYFLKQLKRAGGPHAQLRHFYLAVVQPILEYASRFGTI